MQWTSKNPDRKFSPNVRNWWHISILTTSETKFKEYELTTSVFKGIDFCEESTSSSANRSSTAKPQIFFLTGIDDVILMFDPTAVVVEILVSLWCWFGSKMFVVKHFWTNSPIFLTNDDLSFLYKNTPCSLKMKIDIFFFCS